MYMAGFGFNRDSGGNVGGSLGKNIRRAEQKLNEANAKFNELKQDIQDLPIDDLLAKNAEQDQRIEEVANQYENLDIDVLKERNDKQDVVIEGLFKENDDDRISITRSDSSITLPYAKDGVVAITEIQGKSLTNLNNEPDKEINIMAGAIDFEGYGDLSTINGEENGSVDIFVEGNTMVNLCDQKDSIPLTRSYTVESGNHITLQGGYDGKAKPYVYGNTLVNLWDINGVSVASQATISNGRIKIVTTENIWSNFFTDDKSMFKPSTEYTIIVNIYKNTFQTNDVVHITSNSTGTNSGVFKEPWYIKGEHGVGTFKKKLVTKDTEEFNLAQYCVRSFFSNDSKTPGQEMELDMIILEGDYTDKPLPQYFEGLQSSFEDGRVPENLVGDLYKVTNGYYIDNGDSYTLKLASGNGQPMILYLLNNIKPNTQYTIVAKVDITSGIPHYCFMDMENYTRTTTTEFCPNSSGTHKYLFTTTDSMTTQHLRILPRNEMDSDFTIYKDILILEGDYTNYDFSDYDSANGGKYKVDYKVTGKNKLPSSYQNSWINIADYSVTMDSNYIYTIGYNDGTGKLTLNSTYSKIQLKPNTTYSYHVEFPSNSTLNGFCSLIYDKDNKLINNLNIFRTSSVKYMNFTTPSDGIISIAGSTMWQDTSTGTVRIMITEQSQNNESYEPYKEYTKTLYLNSPLLEGDSIEVNGHDIVHIHRYGKVVLDGSEDWKLYTTNNTTEQFVIPRGIMKNNGIMFSDKLLCKYNLNDIPYSCYVGINNFNLLMPLNTTIDELKAWLQQNPITVVYELETPTYEVISTNDNLYIDSYVNGYLDFNSVVPIEKVNFQRMALSQLKYTKPNTQYICQFNADNEGMLYNIFLNDGNNSMGYTKIEKGINKFIINSTENNTNKYFSLNGIGCNISNIVVTEAVSYDFGYFEGMKSVGEDGELEISSFNGQIDNSNNKIMELIMENGQEVVSSKNNVLITDYNILHNDFTNMTVRLYDKNGNRISGHNGFGDVTKRYYNKKKEYLGNNYNNNAYYVRYRCIQDGTYTNVDDYVFKYEKMKSLQSKLNRQVMTHEPLRAIGDIKDRYVLKDGKWYIERNCAEVVLDGSSGYAYTNEGSTDCIMRGVPLEDGLKDTQIIICDILPYIRYGYSKNIKSISTYGDSKNGMALYISLPKTECADNNAMKEWLYNNKPKVVYQLAEPIYEAIDYNPFEVYSDKTYITTNSVIPPRLTVKNAGFNCNVKPGIIYTLSYTLDGEKKLITKTFNTEDDYIRLYGKGTLGNLVVLEGTDYDNIPEVVRGMESTFSHGLVTDEEDKYYGQYKAEFTMIGQNKFDISQVQEGKYLNDSFKVENDANHQMSGYIPVVPNTTYIISDLVDCKCFTFEKKPIKTHIFKDEIFTTPTNCYYIVVNLSRNTNLDNVQLELGTSLGDYQEYKENKLDVYLEQPLRRIGYTYDRLYTYADKMYLEKRIGVFDVTDDTTIQYINTNKHLLKAYRIPYDMEILGYDIRCNLLPVRDYYWDTSEECISIQNGYFVIFVKEETVEEVHNKYNGLKVTYVLNQAEVKEVEYPYSAIALTCYTNGTLHYNTNMNGQSTVTYTCSIPNVYAMTNNISTLQVIDDEQDMVTLDTLYKLTVLEIMTGINTDDF